MCIWWTFIITMWCSYYNKIDTNKTNEQHSVSCHKFNAHKMTHLNIFYFTLWSPFVCAVLNFGFYARSKKKNKPKERLISK